MHGGAFLNQNLNSKTIRIGLVIGVHAAVLGAVAFAPAELIVREVLKSTRIYNVPVPPDPTPLPPPPKADSQPSNPSQIDRVTTVVNLPSTGGVILPSLPDLPPAPSTDLNFPPPQAHVPTLTSASPDPRFASQFQPDYPPQLARENVEGVVKVRVLIGTDGRVKAVELVSASDPLFFSATERRALKAWRFKPATRDGAAIESWQVMTVRFRMDS